MICFSASLMMRLLRSGPATTRSRASLKSPVLMTFLLRRAARMAASLTRLARSAPEKPGEVLAMSCRSTVLSSGLPLTWTVGVSRRPRRCGRAGEGGAALAADRVDLVHEDDAGAVALGLVEEVAHAAGADAHEHLHELRAGDAEEGHARLAGHGPREQRLARAGRPDEEHAAWDARPERIELLGVLEELHDLLELRLGLVHAGHVGEGHDRLVA